MLTCPEVLANGDRLIIEIDHLLVDVERRIGRESVFFRKRLDTRQNGGQILLWGTDFCFVFEAESKVINASAVFPRLPRETCAWRSRYERQPRRDRRVGSNRPFALSEPCPNCRTGPKNRTSSSCGRFRAPYSRPRLLQQQQQRQQKTPSQLNRNEYNNWPTTDPYQKWTDRVAAA